MGFFSQNFECTECNTVQEQLITNKTHDAEDPCKKCNAPPEKLKKIISAPGKHVSWSMWQAME